MSSRRRLRLKLRRLREDARLSPDDVRKAMEWSLSKVIRIESGGVSVSASDLRNLLTLYNVDDPHASAELLDLARACRKRHWSSAYRAHVPRAYLDFLGYEDDARCIKQFHPLVIPSLFQTQRYARALIIGANRQASTDEVDARVRLGLARRQQVFGRADRPHLQVALDEPALRRRIGGAAAMCQQLDHLIDLSETPDVTCIVIPESLGSHPGLLGAFSLLSFASDEDPDVAYLENVPDDVGLIDDVEDVAAYQENLTAMINPAMQGHDAIAVLKSHRDYYRTSASG
jgi:transcriptional regulator with XRE-family HTH domain